LEIVRILGAFVLCITLQAQEVWRFDRLDRIGGHQVTVEGHPRVVTSQLGQAIEFDGVDDALFIDVHPLAAAETYTWEAVFRPEGGKEEQRWFHLQAENGRMLFEIRVIDGQWCLDAFNMSGDQQKALLNRARLHPLGAWYHVAAVYDGREFRSYVNGKLEESAEIHLAAQGTGHTSVGVRINRRDYFKGMIYSASFTKRALAASEFEKPPGLR
jgi:hypothetical protein